MVNRILAVLVASLAFATGVPLAAQSDDGFAERERELARALAEQQQATERERVAQQDAEARERALEERREIQQQQRELQRQYDEQQRELVAQQREQEREYVAQQREQEREYAEQQREYVAQQRQQQRESAELAHELQQAREQLAASAVEIARLSAQLSGDAVNNGLNRLRILGQRAILGINIEDADNGVRVAGVSPNGPAAAAGVTVNDIIVAIDGFDLRRNGANRVDSPTAAMLGQLGEIEPGQDVELRIMRGGNARNLIVKAGENNLRSFKFEPGQFFAGPNSWVDEPGTFVRMFSGRWGDVELVSLTAALGEYFGVGEGLLVVRAGSMGELGLRDGDVILDIGGREPQTPQHAMRILASFEPGEAIPIAVMRQRRRETVTIAVPDEPRAWFVEPRPSAAPRPEVAPRAPAAPQPQAAPRAPAAPSREL